MNWCATSLPPRKVALTEPRTEFLVNVHPLLDTLEQNLSHERNIPKSYREDCIQGEDQI